MIQHEQSLEKVLTNPYSGLNILVLFREVILMIFERLRAMVAVQFAISESLVTMETSFVDDLGADSLDAVDLIMAIEEEFYIPEVDEDTVNSLITVGDVVRFLSESID